jgi:TonB family protein
MKHGSAMAAGLLAVVSVMAGVSVRGQLATGRYHSAGLAMASDITYPMNSRAPGFVTLDVNLDSTGAVESVAVVRDVPPLTGAAQSAVNGWRFTPATLDGQSVAGILRVDVAFNPYNPSGVGLPGESLQPASGSLSGDFQPAQLLKANYANYPPNTVASGTVVMQAHIGSEGRVHGANVVRGKVGALAGAATKAAKSWNFSPATYKGQAVASDVAIVFVFATPQAGTR